MATRGVKQLTKLSLIYCEHGGSSRHIREFISSGRVIDFARDNPTVDVIVEPHNGKHPLIKGEYRTGKFKQVCIKNEEIKRIWQVITKLNNSSGRKITKIKKPILTQTPSIQGVWTPMLDIEEVQFDIKIV